MARILITGGAGFVGSHLAEHHLAKGDSVWVLDNYLIGKKENLAACFQNPNFRFSQADIITDNIQEPIEWAERIYHLAAIVGYHIVLKRPIDTLLFNIQSCEKVFKDVSTYNAKAKILITSSSEVYGNDYQIPLSENLTLPFSGQGQTPRNYALSKYVNEMTALSYIEEKGIFSVIARIFNTSGSRQGTSANNTYVLPNFIKSALQNKPLQIYGSGKQTRSFCSVHDTVAMLDLFLNTTEISGEILNIGNDKETTIEQLAEIVRQQANSSSEIIYLPYEKAYGRTFYETMHRCPDLTKNRKLLKYKHKYSLQMIIDEMIHYSSSHLSR